MALFDDFTDENLFKDFKPPAAKRDLATMAPVSAKQLIEAMPKGADLSSLTVQPPNALDQIMAPLGMAQDYATRGIEAAANKLGINPTTTAGHQLIEAGAMNRALNKALYGIRMPVGEGMGGPRPMAPVQSQPAPPAPQPAAVPAAPARPPLEDLSRTPYQRGLDRLEADVNKTPYEHQGVQAPPAPRAPVAQPQPAGAAPSGPADVVATGGKEGARAIIRQKLGLAERATRQAQTALDPFRPAINGLDEASKRTFINYMETRSQEGVKLPDHLKGLQEAADAERHNYADIRVKLEGLSSFDKATFIEDYVNHEYKNVNSKAAREFVGAWTSGGGHLKKRSIPTVEDAIAAGLEPKTLDPLELHDRYVASMGKFIAEKQVIESAKQQGVVKYTTLREAPDGWRRLEGAHAKGDSYGRAHYAEPGFATKYNQHASQGWNNPYFNVARQASNIATQLKLAGGGYHALTMTKEAMASDAARAVTSGVHGYAGEALKGLIRAPVSSIANWRLGKVIMEGYEGKRGLSGQQDHIVDMLTQANFRFSGHNREWATTGRSTFLKAWKEGTLKPQFAQAFKNVKDAPGVWKPWAATKEVGATVGQAMHSLSAPLFQQYIPRMKVSAAYTMMEDFLREHPGATHNEQVAAARIISDAVDDRFGMMNQDNIFINKQVKEGLQLGMLSYSWEMGTLRSIGMGLKDIGEFGANKALGALGKEPVFGTTEWTNRASYIIAYGAMVAVTNAAFQYLMTGKPPEDVHDLYAPQTGGIIPADKYGPDRDERALLPGYEKEVSAINEMIQGRKSILTYGGSKLAPALKLAGNLITGTDWRNDPIADPNAAFEQHFFQRWIAPFGELVTPIPVTMAEQEKVGSNIGTMARVMGIRPAPSELQDPSRHGDMLRSVATRDWIKKLYHDKTAAEKLGRPDIAKGVTAEIKRHQAILKKQQEHERTGK